MLNYNHLYYFHVAASEGSVAAAAAQMGVTQPTVSEQIRALERVLDVTLFERTATGLRLTEIGRLAHQHTSAMFTAGDRLIEALGYGPDRVARSLRVGISAPVARSTAADFLMPLFAIEDCYPTIRIGDTAELVRDLRASDIDLVLTESPPPESTRRRVECIDLAKSSLVAIAPPSLRPSANWENVGIVKYRITSSIRWVVDAYLEEQGLKPRAVGEVDDALLLIEAAARGGFVAFVPRAVARDPVAMGRLHIIATIDTAQATIHALHQSGESAELARRAVAALIEHAQSMAD